MYPTCINISEGMLVEILKMIPKSIKEFLFVMKKKEAAEITNLQKILKGSRLLILSLKTTLPTLDTSM